MALSYAPKGTATPTSAPAYTPASSSSGSSGSSSGSVSSWSSSSSGSGSSSGSTKNESYSAGKGSGSASYIKTGKHTVKYLEPKLDKKARIAVVPDEVKIGKKMFQVTSVSTYAFIGHDSLHMVKLGKNVKKLEASAFAGCYDIKTLKVSSRNLTAKSVKGCLTDSRINKVLVTKNAANKLSSYKKAFGKENSQALQNVTVKKASN